MAELTRPKKSKTRKKLKAPVVSTQNLDVPLINEVDIVKNDFVINDDKESCTNLVTQDLNERLDKNNFQTVKFLSGPVDTERTRSESPSYLPAEGVVTENVNTQNQLKSSFSVDILSNKDDHVTEPIEESIVCSPPSTQFQYNISTNPYEDVIEAVEGCLNEGVVPSAPLIVEEEAEEADVNDRIIETDFLEDVRIDAEIILQCYEINLEYFEQLEPLDEKRRKLLYNNEKINAISDYVCKFIDDDWQPNEELRELLWSYLNHRVKTIENVKQLEELKESQSKYVKELWTVWRDVEIRETSKCLDSRNQQFSYKFQQARYNTDVANELKFNYSEIRRCVFNDYESNVIKASFFRHEIVYYLGKILTNFQISLEQSLREDEDYQKSLTNLKSAISTLFYFQRNATAMSFVEFAKETKIWLISLCKMLLSTNNWEDRMFVSSHMLRCPGNVAKWTESLMSSSDNVDVVVASLAFLLRPIVNREQFLKEFIPSEDTNASWALLDSEGEDEFDDNLHPLKENDLLAFLNSIPLANVLEELVATNNLDVDILTKINLLHEIVGILGEGIHVFNAPRYRLFQRYLAKLIRTCVQTATFLFDVYSNNTQSNPLMPRIQVEYDEVVVTAAQLLTRGSDGVWLYLVNMPFRYLSKAALFRMLATLLMYDGTSINLADFETKLARLPNQDQNHLLSALASLAEDAKYDEKLVLCAGMTLMHIAGLSSAVDEAVVKHAEVTLTGLCVRHSFLLSHFISQYQLSFDRKVPLDDGRIDSLWTSLPVCYWRPSVSDFTLLTKWLRRSFSSTESVLARRVFSDLNYEAIPFDMQVKIAFSILKTAKLFPGNVQLQVWAWNTLMQLKLHLLDRTDLGDEYFIYHLKRIPSIDSFKELQLLVQSRNPLGYFLALSLCDLGHFVPLICTEGFSLLKTLNHRKAALLCLYHLTGMCLSCSDHLISCEPFLSLIGDFAQNNVHEAMAAMVSQQFASWGKTYKKEIVKLWVCSLTTLSKWHENRRIIFILDVLFRHALINSKDCWEIVVQNLGQIVSAESTAVESPKSLFSPVLNLFKGPTVPSLLPLGYDNNVPWFAYAIISIEFKVYEQQTKLWDSLLKDIWNGRAKNSGADATLILKKTCTMLNLPQRPLEALCIYRWAMQILHTDPAHPAYILLWQKFFDLFMYRIPGVVDRGGVGKLLFKKTDILEKLKHCLNKTVIMFKNTIQDSIFNAFTFWLEDEALDRPHLLLHSLSSSYCIIQLNSIIQRHEDPWTNLIPHDKLFKYDKKHEDFWNAYFGKRLEVSRKLSNSHSDVKFNLLEIFDELKRTSKSFTGQSENRSDLDKFVPETRSVEAVLASTKAAFDLYMQKYRKRVELCDATWKSLEAASMNLWYSLPKTIRLVKECNGGYEKVNDVRKVFVPCRGPAIFTLTCEEWYFKQSQQISMDKSIIELKKELEISALNQSVEKLKKSEIFLSKLAELLDEHRTTKAFHLEQEGLQMFQFLIAYSKKHGSNASPGLLEILRSWLVTTCNAFVKDNSRLCLQLLEALDCDLYSDILSPLFQPLIASNQLFCEMYESDYSNKVNILEKYNIEQWLLQKTPNLNLRCRIVVKIMQRLERWDGKDCSLLQLLNEHLRLILLHHGQDHFCQVLRQFLTMSRNKVLPKESWICFLSWLHGIESFHYKPTLDPFDYLLSIKGQSQGCAIPTAYVRQVILELVAIFDRKEESLYHFYGDYCYFFAILYGIFSCEIIKSTEDIEEDWELLLKFWSPWLFPSVISGNKTHFAFGESDIELYKPEMFLGSFNICIRYLVDVDAKTVLSLVWKYFIKVYKSDGLSDRICSIFTVSFFNRLPWYLFLPKLQDVESLFEAVDHAQLSSCRVFISSVFLQIKWDDVIEQSRETCNFIAHLQLHVYILHLFVKLANEKHFTIEQTEEFKIKFLIVKNFDWNFIDPRNFSVLVNWFTANFPAETVVEPSWITDKPTSLQSSVIMLLKIVSCFDGVPLKEIQQQEQEKRVLFLRMIIKCMALSLCQTNKTAAVYIDATKKTLMGCFNLIENAAQSCYCDQTSQLSEINTLMSEVLRLFEEIEFSKILTEALTSWIMGKKGALTALAFLKCIRIEVDDPIIFGSIIEACLENYFETFEQPSWKNITFNIILHSSYHNTLEQCLIGNGHLLTLSNLHTINLNQRPFINTLVQMFPVIKLSEEIEPKVVHLLCLTLKLIKDEADLNTLLQSLAESVYKLSADRRGVFASIGLSRGYNPTLGFKVISLTTAATISVLLKKNLLEDEFVVALKKAQKSKQFAPIQAHTSAVMTSFESTVSVDELIMSIRNLAIQFFRKRYYLE